MKKLALLFLALASATVLWAQHCGTDQHQAKLERENPEIKQARLKMEEKLLSMDIGKFLESKGIKPPDRGTRYNGTIYEIPVVVHVIEDGVHNTVTDAEIETWIENTNKQYATTYPSFFPEGNGNYDGNVIPIKLVLAKRDPQCQATNGIIRFTSTNAAYKNHGVNRNNTDGVSNTDIKTWSPHWPEHSYFNIYLINGFDSNFTNYGLMGWCGFPTNTDQNYESFMKMPVVTNNGTTLAHEFGHGMGLHHPFKGIGQGSCSPNNNCATDNDKVCDTEPINIIFNINPFPGEADINPCTGEAYQGGQHNVMNYTSQPKKFTAGQRERALAIFLTHRENLTTSLGGTPPSATTINVTSTTCSPNNTPNIYRMGPTKVELGNIINSTPGYHDTEHPYDYIDYITKTCLNSSFFTEIPNNSSSELKVTTIGNKQYIKAWIDYNNNGELENSEIIGEKYQDAINETTVFSFTPPSNAVTNTPLRMRVAADFHEPSACGNYQYGQAEDYAVTITSILPVELTTFNGAKEGKAIVLHWKTLSEINNAKFTLKHSTDGVNFTTISELAGAGNSNIATKYEYVDTKPVVGINYYQLSQSNYDGSHKNLKTIAVEFNDTYANTFFNIYPNPLSEKELKIEYETNNKGTLDIMVLNMVGQVIKQQRQMLSKGKNLFSINLEDMQTGVYFIKVNEAGKTYTKRLVKN